MKKKSFLAALVILTVACALLVTACPDDNNPGTTSQHTDPSFLVGTWTYQTAGRSFTIAQDLSFVCQLMMQTGQAAPNDYAPAQVSGNLDATSAGLGPDDYILKNLAASGDSATFPGNAGLTPSLLSGFQNIPVKIEPNATKTEFEFSGLGTATGGPVTDFFGGRYTKQQ